MKDYKYLRIADFSSANVEVATDGRGWYIIYSVITFIQENWNLFGSLCVRRGWLFLWTVENCHSIKIYVVPLLFSPADIAEFIENVMK